MTTTNVDLIEVKLGRGSTVRCRPEHVLTHERFIATLTERFGDSPYDWAFVCPNCGDVATGADFKAALAEHPHTRRDGESVTASNIMGQQCIGRTLGALSGPASKWKGRGCDWAAGGLFSGPTYVQVDDDHYVPSFAIAPAASL
jgi:hypothetical protein